MDRLAFGTDSGKIYIVPALKLITTLFLNSEHEKEKLSKRILRINETGKSKTLLFRFSNTDRS